MHFQRLPNEEQGKRQQCDAAQNPDVSHVSPISTCEAPYRSMNCAAAPVSERSLLSSNTAVTDDLAPIFNLMSEERLEFFGPFQAKLDLLGLTQALRNFRFFESFL